MAQYQAVRPLWTPRGEAVHYVMNNHLYVRGWPSRYRDANTQTQRKQRGKMAQVCQVLPHLKSLLAEGYRPLQKANGRRIASYHVAVSTALREWFVDSPTGPALDTSKIELTQGVRALPHKLATDRTRNGILIHWAKRPLWAGPRLLLAVKNTHSDEWVTHAMGIGHATSLLATLPDSWSDCKVEIFVAFVGDSQRVCTRTHAVTLLPTATSSAVTIPTGPSHASVSLQPALRPGAKPAVPKRQPITVPAKPNCCACRFGLRDVYCTAAPGSTIAPSAASSRQTRHHAAPPNPNRAPLGPLRGSVGPAAFSSWRGLHYVKSRPARRESPPRHELTPRQTTFAKRARCASRLLPAARTGLLPHGPASEAFRTLMQRLYEANGDPRRLRLACGSYLRPHDLKFSVLGSLATLSWSGPRGNPGDRLHVVVISRDESYAKSRCVPLAAQQVVFSLPEGANIDHCIVFISNHDGTKVGDSVCAENAP